MTISIIDGTRNEEEKEHSVSSSFPKIWSFSIFWDNPSSRAHYFDIRRVYLDPVLLNIFHFKGGGETLFMLLLVRAAISRWLFACYLWPLCDCALYLLIEQDPCYFGMSGRLNWIFDIFPIRWHSYVYVWILPSKVFFLGHLDSTCIASINGHSGGKQRWNQKSIYHTVWSFITCHMTTVIPSEFHDQNIWLHLSCLAWINGLW